MRVVGSTPALGTWDPKAALAMHVGAEIDNCREWRVTTQCPLGQAFEFKFVGMAGSEPCWETGENRVCSPMDEWTEMVDGFRA
jgi:hypothetical protein